jgi:hypothetical protein
MPAAGMTVAAGAMVNVVGKAFAVVSMRSLFFAANLVALVERNLNR